MLDRPQKFQSTISHGLNNAAERPNPIKLDIRGQIPPWLSGALYVPARARSAPLDTGTNRNPSTGSTSNRAVGYGTRAERLVPGPSYVMEHGTKLLFLFDNGDPCETYFQQFTTYFNHSITRSE